MATPAPTPVATQKSAPTAEEQLRLRLGQSSTPGPSNEPSSSAPVVHGTATFNYIKTAGNCSIGKGVFLFETHWTRRTSTSIYCHTTPSVQGTALAPRGAKLADIKDASALVSSSRVQAPAVGQLVVLNNKDGFYAALRIVDVKNDFRNAEANMLTFRYWILTDGSKDFSRITE